MKRNDMVSQIANYLIGYNKLSDDELNEYKRKANCLLKFMEGLGMRPPQVDGKKGQILLQRYVDPNFNMWDDEYEKLNKEWTEKWRPVDVTDIK